jgi:hypothetical protein
MTARKGISAADGQSSSELLSIGDERWAAIASRLPQPLGAESSEQLRSSVLACCSVYLTSRMAVEGAAATAAAVRRPGKRQLAHLEQLAESLRSGADAWAKIGKMIHDDRLSDIRIYEGLEAMAVDAERRLRGIRDLGKPVRLKNPWPNFVRAVAATCRRINLQPTATGAVYDQRRPSWFQEFIVAINDNILGDLGGRRHSKASQYAEIAKALRGNAKPGKARV